MFTVALEVVCDLILRIFIFKIKEKLDYTLYNRATLWVYFGFRTGVEPARLQNRNLMRYPVTLRVH